MLPVSFFPASLDEIFCKATVTKTLTAADRYGLMAALLDGTLAADEIAAVDRLLLAVKRGRIALA